MAQLDRPRAECDGTVLAKITAMKIALADIIHIRHLLAPREAATLTLAIGREWDRQRARHGAGALPAIAHIELNDAGEISFAENTTDPPVHGALTLSAILGHLLGLDEQDAPAQHIPGGLLITIAGRLGPLELPSSREDGFRSALLRFADDDPAVLVRVFDRIVQARTAAGPEAAQSRGSKIRRGPERRRQPPAVAALRRAVRELERQTFESRIAGTRLGRNAPAVRTIGINRRSTRAVVASTAALLLVLGGFLLGSVSMRTPESTQPLTQLPTEPSPSPEVLSTPVRLAQEGVRERARVVAAGDREVTVRRSTRAPQQTRVQTRKTPPSQPHVTLAGGARTITCSRPAR